MFSHFRRFLIRYGQLNFLYDYPVSWASGQIFYLLAILSVSQPLQETLQQFILCCSVFYKVFTRLDLVYVLPESKICFFEKKQIKLFCCFRYYVICNLQLITSLLLLISCFYVKLVKLKSDFIYRMLARGCYFYQLPFLIRSNLYTNVQFPHAVDHGSDISIVSHSIIKVCQTCGLLRYGLTSAPSYVYVCFLLIRLLYMSDNYISSTFLYVIPIFLQSFCTIQKLFYSAYCTVFTKWMIYLYKIANLDIYV